MNPQHYIDTKQLSELIKNLHNHQKINFPQQFPSILSNPIQLATLNLLNLQINDSLDDLKHEPHHVPKYFQRDTFVISSTMRKIGNILKILSSLCQFEDPRQKCLAGFDTINFYQETQQSNVPLQFIDFLKGIFPSMNVHKDNIPLYMPFWERLENYNSMIGNSNWEISRHNLDLIYRTEILSPSEKEDNWYLLLTGSRKLLELYQKTPIETLWAHMYYFYVNSTLKPYRYISSKKQSSEQMDLRKIIEIILEKIKLQTNSQISQLLTLVLYALTKDNEELEKSFRIFEKQFKLLLQSLQRDPTFQKQCSEWALINSMYCQLFHNLNEKNAHTKISDEPEFNKLKSMLDSTIELIQMTVTKAIPCSDCYLRIAFSSYSRKKHKIQKSNEKILSTLKEGLQKSSNNFPFLVYEYWDKEISEPFSTFYLEKYPQKILQLVNFLPTQTIIWKLLNSEKLNNFEDFLKIENCLREYQVRFMGQIRQKFDITEEDYERFIDAWNMFNDILKTKKIESDVDYHLQKACNCLMALRDIANIQINEEFKKNVYLPLQKSQNILKLTDVIIQGFDEHFSIMNQNQQQKILKEYLSFLLDEEMKKNVIGVLNEEDTTEFWKKWTSVYMNDPSLIAELTNSIQSAEQPHEESGLGNRIQEEPKPKSKQIVSEFIELQ